MQSGGIFNHYKANYSPETQKLLQVLMEEARLSLAQRRDFNARIMADHPLPPRVKTAPRKVDTNLFDMKPNYFFSKRSLDRIKSAGYYEPEQLRRGYPSVDRENEKEELAHIMTFGKRPQKAKQVRKPIADSKPTCLTRQQRLEELKFEIEDRIKFLMDMRALRQAGRYEAGIKQEIAAKQRDLKRIEKMTDDQFNSLNLN